MTLRFVLALAFCTVAFSAYAQDADNQTELVVPAHDIARGAVIADGDLTTKSFPVLRMNESFIHNLSDIEGKEAKRALRAGEVLRLSDLKRPALVAKGATVTMVFDAPGMSLTAVGRALAEGGEGDSIAVLNPTSYRQVVAVVTAPGVVRVGPADASAKTNEVAIAK
ncbi:MAG TPA: flagellar basal body P-ring formation chaperone FlgA [Micropepsaceae bacterium]|jgi:flagella basal body P-ring formation protein FlgA